MGKIYEALTYAGKVSKDSEKRDFSLSKTIEQPSLPLVVDLAFDEEMAALYQSIDSLLPDGLKRAIQFISSREGEGTSTIARQFADVADKRFGKSVLIVDTDTGTRGQFQYFGIQPRITWEHVVVDEQPVGDAIYRVGDSNVSISLISLHSAFVHRVVNLRRFKELLEKLKEQFDLIVIDSAPAGNSSDGIALSSYVDGVVVILEAEETRWLVAENLKDRVMKNGGNILGVVLNKRRYYIPEFIYRLI